MKSIGCLIRERDDAIAKAKRLQATVKILRVYIETLKGAALAYMAHSERGNTEAARDAEAVLDRTIEGD